MEEHNSYEDNKTEEQSSNVDNLKIEIMNSSNHETLDKIISNDFFFQNVTIHENYFPNVLVMSQRV